MNQKMEYNVILESNYHDLEERLNSVAKTGWTISKTVFDETAASFIVIMEREVSENGE